MHLSLSLSLSLCAVNRPLASQKEKERKDAERKEREAADLKSKADAAAKEKEKAAFKPYLSLPAFKAHWSKLGPSGSFQCKLKSMPDATVLANHLKKQGFHVVFEHNQPNGDVEIGFCNVRKAPAASAGSAGSGVATAAGGGAPEEAVFMARFVASGTSFNAVMKSDDAANVPGFVKKFALAKVLKIDTSGAK